jgi:hypothetical protein
MRKSLIFILASLYFFSACTKKIPILEPAKMQAVMWDVIQLEAYSQLIVAPDSMKMNPKKNALLQQKIFSLHGVSKDQYYKSYEYYSAHPEMMRIIFDSITTKADRNRGKMMEKRYGKPVLVK